MADLFLMEEFPETIVIILPLFLKFPENEGDGCSSHPLHFQESFSNSVLTELEKLKPKPIRILHFAEANPEIRVSLISEFTDFIKTLSAK